MLLEGASPHQWHLAALFRWPAGSFAIFDELVPAERLEQMKLIDVVRYRKETAGAREAFLEHLAALHAKQGTVHDGDYSAAIKNIIVGDILPEARKFKNALDNVYERLVGTLAAGAFLYAGSGAALQIFGDISWVNLLRLAGLVGGAIGGVAIDAKQKVRAARRDCAISYLLEGWTNDIPTLSSHASPHSD